MDNDINNFLALLDGTNNSPEPLWGKMTFHHMIEHLILSVRMGNGTLKVECFNPKEKWPALKKFLLSSRPLPQNFINPIIGENLLPLEFNSPAEAIAVLNIEVENFDSYFKNNPGTVLTNATFGELNKEEWDVFHKKHFTHHFRQFGIIK